MVGPLLIQRDSRLSRHTVIYHGHGGVVSGNASMNENETVLHVRKDSNLSVLKQLPKPSIFSTTFCYQQMQPSNRQIRSKDNDTTESHEQKSQNKRFFYPPLTPFPDNQTTTVEHEQGKFFIRFSNNRTKQSK
jgi:hypothetical protein